MDWWFQPKTVDAIRDRMILGDKHVLNISPTGSGKTHIAAQITKLAREVKNKNVHFLVDQNNLVDQTSKTFSEYGITHGIIQGDHPGVNPNARTQIVSIQTAMRRGIRDPDLIIVDEAHVQWKYVYQLMEKFDGVRFIGLTATMTPGLGRWWDSVVQVVDTKTLIEQGYLCPFEAYGDAQIYTGDIELNKAGEYRQDAKRAKIQKSEIVADIVDNYLEKGEDMQAIVFAQDVAHSKSFLDRFKKRGNIIVEHIDAYTKRDIRDGIIERYETGRTRILTSVGVLTKGFDSKCAQIGIFANPFKKAWWMFIQQAGRTLRRFDGNDYLPAKTHCKYFDHVNNHHFCDVDDPLPNTLTKTNKKISLPIKKEPVPCHNCGHLKRSPKCPKCGLLDNCKLCGANRTSIDCGQCGFKPVPKTDKTEIEGELIRIKGKKYTKLQLKDWYRMALGKAIQKGKETKYAAGLYKSKYDQWPDWEWNNLEPLDPDRDFNNYMKHLRIKYIKGKEKYGSVNK